MLNIKDLSFTDKLTQAKTSAIDFLTGLDDKEQATAAAIEKGDALPTDVSGAGQGALAAATTFEAGHMTATLLAMKLPKNLN